MFPLVRYTVFLRSTVQCSYVPVSSFLPLDDCSVNANDLHLLRFEISVSPLLCDLLSHRLAVKGFRGSPGWFIDGHVLGNVERLRENVGAAKQPSPTTAIWSTTAYLACALFLTSLHIWSPFPYTLSTTWVRPRWGMVAPYTSLHVILKQTQK